MIDARWYERMRFILSDEVLCMSRSRVGGETGPALNLDNRIVRAKRDDSSFQTMVFRSSGNDQLATNLGGEA